MLVEVAAALVEDDRAAETLAAVRPGRPGLSDGPGPAARAASPRPSLSSLHGACVRARRWAGRWIWAGMSPPSAGWLQLLLLLLAGYSCWQ